MDCITNTEQRKDKNMPTVPENMIIRVLQKTATSQEIETLNKWLLQNEENIHLFYQMQEIWDLSQPMTDNDVTRSWNKMYRKLPSVKPAGKRKAIAFHAGRWGKYAAALLIGFIAAAVWFGLQQDTPVKETIVRYNMVYNHQGTQKIVLPDSSTVWLGSNSNLSYPEHFGDGKRLVNLEGKAYFDIRSRNGQAFMVQSDNTEVEVTGTEFEVENTGDNNIITLVSGTISVTGRNADGSESDHVSMIAGQQVRVDKHNGSMEVVDILTYDYAAWKDGTYRFNDEPIEQIARLLSLHYHIDIHISPELKGKRFTGRVTARQDIREVMTNIRASHPVQYKITSKGVYISEK